MQPQFADKWNEPISIGSFRFILAPDPMTMTFFDMLFLCYPIHNPLITLMSARVPACPTLK